MENDQEIKNQEGKKPKKYGPGTWGRSGTGARSGGDPKSVNTSKGRIRLDRNIARLGLRAEDFGVRIWNKEDEE